MLGEDRLNDLSLMYIHRDNEAVQNLQPLSILKMWDASLHRKIALAFANPEPKSEKSEKGLDGQQ